MDNKAGCKSISVVGAGSRGMIYAGYAHDVMHLEIAAAADPREERLQMIHERFGTPAERLFTEPEEFFRQGRLSDAIVIASMDRDHYRQTMRALGLGYHVLLEKPISPDPREAMAIRNKAHAVGRKVVVCHVLRYTNFFTKLKEIVDSGELGRVVTIQHAENVGNFHMAHSFVRGNWRRSDTTSSMIMQKSCHDMDILTWFAGSPCRTISSYGNLSYFRKENAPAESALRCCDCRIADNCRFNAYKAYLPALGDWPADVVTPSKDPEVLRETLKTSPYGRCVFHCDNNVCDNQVTTMEFDNGITATFHLSGFTNKMHRHIKIMFENGEVEGDDLDNIIHISRFASNNVESYETREIHVSSAEGFHGGGDYGLMVNFVSGLEDGKTATKSSVDESTESHIMAYAAELSRTEERTVDVDALRKELEEEAKGYA